MIELINLSTEQLAEPLRSVISHNAAIAATASRVARGIEILIKTLRKARGK
jgi:hypothetical protein